MLRAASNVSNGSRVKGLFPLLPVLFVLSFGPSWAAKVADSLDNPPVFTKATARSTSFTPILLPVIPYTAEQIESILQRCDTAWGGFRAIRRHLRLTDENEQSFAHRAEVLHARAGAMERLLAAETRKPTREGAQNLKEGFTALDRAAAPVEHDLDRIRLRLAQEALLPPRQPFCIGVARAYVRISPTGPDTPCAPAVEANVDMARGESESFQLVIVPYWEDLRDVRIELGEIYRADSIDRFQPDQGKLWMVESVATASPVGRDRLWPDPLGSLRPFDLPSTASQAILVDVHARPDQPAGLYQGELRVKTANLGAMSLVLRIRVRPFALPKTPLPQVAFRARNDFLQARLDSPVPSPFAEIWENFLSGYSLTLFRRVSPEDSGSGWLPWVVDHSPQSPGTIYADPYSPFAPTTLAYRQAVWAGWNLRRRSGALLPPKWLVNGWVSLDSSPSTAPRTLIAPLVRTRWDAEKSPTPPGLIFINPAGLPEPTLRLIALRDGVEDFGYLEMLDRYVEQSKRQGAAWWWTRRKWDVLLRESPALADPRRISPELAGQLRSRRQAIADAIEQIQRLLGR